MVWALCRRLADDPEDAYQAIWERVFREMARFDPDGVGSLGGWIRTVARRQLIDRHRRAKTRGTIVPLPDLRSASAPDLEVQLKRRRERLEMAIACLPHAQRRVIVLHHIQGVPLPEIAALEDVAIGTLKSRLHRARARLTSLIGRSE